MEHAAADSTNTGRARSCGLGLPSKSCVRGWTGKSWQRSSACDVHVRTTADTPYT